VQSPRPGAQPTFGVLHPKSVAPAWLARPENRVDALVGNPPWLGLPLHVSSAPRGLSASGQRAQAVDGRGQGSYHATGPLGFLRGPGVELYYAWADVSASSCRRPSSLADLRRLPNADYSSASDTCLVAFDPAWDLENVEPGPFPVPSATVSVHDKTRSRAKLPGEVVVWSGRAPRHAGEAGA